MIHRAALATALFALVPALLALCLAAWSGRAAAQDGDLAISDSLFIERPKEPVSYTTTYNRDLSSGNWSQALTYNHNARRISFGLTGATNTVEGLRGLSAEGLAGDLGGNFTFKATNRWLWSLDGRGSMNSTEDDRTKTDRRQSRLQLRTQYSFNPQSRLSGTGIVFAELQGDQSLTSRTIPGQVRQEIDSTVAPPDTTLYRAHSSRDSSFTSGLRNGFSGTVRWKPVPWLDVTGMGVATSIRSKTETRTRDFFAINAGDPASLVLDSLGTSDVQNGDRRAETKVMYTGLKRTLMSVTLKGLDTDQGFYSVSRRGQEHLSYGSTSGAFHLETALLTGSQFTLDAGLSRSLREYDLDSTRNSLVRPGTIDANFFRYRTDSRITLGFHLGRTDNERQITQNGFVIDRALTAGGAKRVSSRLWLDGTASLSLFSRHYDDESSDRDDARGYGSMGGGYRVSDRCSTTVHFSTTRAHAVSIAASASGENYVQSTYQMDATLRLLVTPRFTIFQNYSLNANYQIYDYDEVRNRLTRIRRIDTVLSDSLFPFCFVSLTHNFFFQDTGGYSREEEGGDRTYSVASELYQQHLSATVGIRPFQGVVLTAVQSLTNARSYITTSSAEANSNRWNLNLGATLDRQLPGDMTLQGTIQRIDEYTELPNDLPAILLVDYWTAMVQFSKDF